MSYDRITPAYYKTFQPDTPYHPGARGWTEAPWPTWGDNPNLAGKRLLATDGLGAITAISGLSGLGSPDGLGAYFQNTYVQPISPAGGGGTGCAPCAAKAAAGLGMDTSSPAFMIGKALVLGAIGYGIYRLFS